MLYINIPGQQKPDFNIRYLSSVMGLLATILFVISSAPVAEAQSTNAEGMNYMNHGPFISSTIVLDPRSSSGAARDILAYKGILVKLGGEESSASMVFDTDLMRVAGAWTGGSLHWYEARDGLEQWPTPDGFMQFMTSNGPGWAVNGNFHDQRPWRYGPVSKDLARYKGLYLQDENIVFSYSVGGTDVLESFRYDRAEGHPVFSRTLNIAATIDNLSLRVLQAPEGRGVELEQDFLANGEGVLKVKKGEDARLIGFRGLPEGASWRINLHHLVLDLPEMEQDSDFQLLIGPVLPLSDAGLMADYVQNSDEYLELARYTSPGEKLWEPLETESRMGTEEGPFAVDELTLPVPNPWNSFIRLTDLDFLSDGRAVVASLSGDVWMVEGIEETESTLTWHRFATGLNQPLGLRVVDDKIYVTGRDQITILHDLNGNNQADFYENFNNEVMAASNFHAFNMNLETDSEGNFYFAKATPWPPWSGNPRRYAEVTSHHGVLFRLSPDGEDLDVIATGLRNPNGLTVGPGDEIVYADNEGNYVPTSFVQRIREGGFHGFVPSAHLDRRPQDEDFEKPIAWLPHHVDNSPAKPSFITSESWPEKLQNHLMVVSYGRANLSLLLNEEVDGMWQSAHLPLPLTFKSGLERGRFHTDGHFYIAGMTSWQSVGEEWGSFHRVRYTGQPLNLPVDILTKDGVLELRFIDEMDREAALNPENYNLQKWTYPWFSGYGTGGQVYSVENPGEAGPDVVEISGISISDDSKSVYLEIPYLTPGLLDTEVPLLDRLSGQIKSSLGLVMAIQYNLESDDGTALNHQIHKTIHRVPQ
jgi:glucose/arabinose dehydrogenase